MEPKRINEKSRDEETARIKGHEILEGALMASVSVRRPALCPGTGGPPAFPSMEKLATSKEARTPVVRAAVPHRTIQTGSAPGRGGRSRAHLAVDVSGTEAISGSPRTAASRSARSRLASRSRGS